MRGAVVAAVAVVAILIGAGAGYLVGGARERTVTSTSTLVTTSTLTTAPLNQSLELFAEVFPSTMKGGQNIVVWAEVFNPLASPVTVSLNSAPCGVMPPTSYQIFTGYHTLPSALYGLKPLLLYNASITVPCIRSYNTTFVFQPNSDIVYDSSFLGTNTHPVNYTSVLSGYYTPSGQLADGRTNYSFQFFPPGAYTVLIEDAWGQRQLQYFTVY